MKLLGRELYQTPLGEPLLVWAPLTLHIAASTLKLIFIGLPKRLAVLSSTAWPLAVFFLPVHVLVHRVHPAFPGSPVEGLGPSQLDFEYVKYGFERWPMLSWTLFGGLISCVILHSLEGSRILWRVWSIQKRSKSSAASNNVVQPITSSKLHFAVDGGRRLILPTAVVAAMAIGTFGSILGGLAILASEPVFVSNALSVRMHGAYTRSGFWYNL